MSVTSQFEIFHLNSQLGGRVRYEDEEGKRYLLTVEQAIRACRAYDDKLLFNEQLHRLWAFLSRWWNDHQSSISRAILTVRDTGLFLVLVQKQVEIDTKLEDAIVELYHLVVNDPDFSLIRLDAISVPQCTDLELSSFVDSKNTLELALNNAQ